MGIDLGALLEGLSRGDRTIRRRDAEQSALADEAMRRKREQAAMDDDAVRRKRAEQSFGLDQAVQQAQLRNMGYVPDAEATGDNSGVSGHSLDQAVGAATGQPIMGMSDVQPRYGASVGGYRYDRANSPAARTSAERGRRRSNLLTGGIDPSKVDMALDNPSTIDDLMRKPVAQHEPLVVVVRGGKRVYVPQSQAAGGEAPSPAPAAARHPVPGDFEKRAAFLLEGAERAVKVLDGYSAPAASVIRHVPGLGNYGLSETDQVAQEAAETLYDAYLRLTTGASIQPAELKNAAKQMIAQPGDKPATLRQKAIRRREVIRAMRRAASVAMNADGGGQDVEPATETPGLPYPDYQP